MAKLTKRAAQAALEKPDRFLYVTYGGEEPIYSVNGAGTVARRTAEQLTLFPLNPGAADLVLVASDDGLFPGMSQTWRARQ